MKFYSLGQLNNEDKNNILQKHREVYNGYRTVWQPVSNEQPLYVQDFANDKLGVQVDNKGGVSSYNNKVYMREQVEETELDTIEVEEDQHLDIEKDIDPDAEFDYIEPKEIDFDEFSSAFSDELEEEIGGPLYSEVDPAYSFVSDGPLREDDLEEGFYDTNDYDEFDFQPKSIEDYSFEEDLPSYQEDLLTKIRKTPEEDIVDVDFEEIDEDIKESFLLQKNKINEMFLRFSKYN